MQGALVHIGACHHALELLVVSCVVLQRSSYAQALDTLDVGSRHFPGKHRIFREVLEIPAA